MDAPETPADSPLTLETAMASPLYRRLMDPELRPGEPAFPFDLPLLDPETHRPSGDRVAARRLRGRAPGRARLRLLHLTALPPPVGRAGGALRPARREVAFFIVYIREAHPEDGWVLADNRREEIAVVDPVSLDERAEAADACALRLATRIPILLDDVDDAVASAYGGWPDRLYLIGRDGRVAFQGEVGPFGFKPEELAQRDRARARGLGRRRLSTGQRTRRQTSQPARVRET